MKTKATATHIRQSPSKVRQVLNLIRGMPVPEAQATLEFVNRRAAHSVGKVLNSAVANAENNLGLDPDELVVAVAYADKGPTLKRFRARARGRGTMILKRTSHITIVVAEPEDWEDEEDEE